MVELVQWDGGTDEPIRDVARPWDYGLLTLNFATTDIERAIPHLQSFGATFVSPPHVYELAPGKRLREVMVYAPGGERHTLLQVGEATPGSAHPLSGPVVTVGMMVPSIAAARAFYGDALGLSVAMETERIGGPFTQTMKVPAETRMQMLLLTSGGNWTGKLMLFELTLPDGDLGAQDRSERIDGRFTGHWMLSLVASDLDVLAERCREAGARVLNGPVEIDRPFIGRTRAMILRAPGGVPLEVIG
jgi:catechol 2,3-dioxygenase-like lactoylglutathione lyase family enzyme